MAIKNELIQKGVSRDIIEEVLSEQTSEEGEQKLAEQALEKKMRSFQALDQMEFKQKTLQFLMRRGFSYDTAKDVVEEFVKKVYN